MMTFTPALVITAAGFIALGAIALIRPAHIMSYFGVTHLTPDLRNEIRAVYGGFGIALGGLMLWSADLAPYAAGVRLSAATALAGMAGGRLVGFCCERTGRWPIVFAGVELALAALLFASA